VSVPSPPFVGLAAFTPRTAAYFTGRERFALTLAGAVLRSRVTVMYGQSGCGKSSVLGAALPQAMQATLRRAAALMHRAPFRLLYFRRWHPGFENRLFSAVAAKLSAPKGAGLASAVAGWDQDREHKAPVILVLDQFEEFLLYHPKPAETSFVRDLASVVADPDNEAHVLLSLREDSLASLDALRAVIPGVLSSPVQLRPLDRKAAEQAIRRPVTKWSEQRFGDPAAVVVEDSLVDALLDQVQETATLGPSVKLPANSDTNFVELPFLQLALERLWKEEARDRKFALRSRTLEQLGGATGIAQEHLDKTLETLPDSQRALAIRLFRHLVTSTGAKHAWRADDLAKEIDTDPSVVRLVKEHKVLGHAVDAIDKVIERIGEASRRLSSSTRASVGSDEIKTAVAGALDKLADGKARILRTQPDPRGQEPLFELYHDALARPVLSWVQEARIKEAERRQARRAASAVVAALLMAVVIGVVYFFYHRAVSQQAQAQLQEARAVSTLARQATEHGDAMTGMLATLAVLPRDPVKPDRPVSTAAAAVLLDAWLRNREKFDLLGHLGPIESVAFSPNGERVVTGSDDHTARVWDLSGATPAASVLKGHSGRVNSAAFGPDGKRVVTGSDDGTARVWDLSEATPSVTLLEGHGGAVTSVAFSPDGRHVVSGSTDNTARVWDLSGAIPTATVLEGHSGRVNSAAFSPDGKRVVTGSNDGTARVWDLSEAAPSVTVLKDHPGWVMSVAFSPDGKQVVTGSLEARVWDLSSAPPFFTVLEGHLGLVTSVAFGGDNRHLITGSDDDTARVWDLSGAAPAATVLEGHRGRVTSVAFNPDGRLVVTGSSDNTARVWDPSGPTPVMIPLDGLSGAMAITPDGRRVVTGSSDNTARVWDLSGTTPVVTSVGGLRGAMKKIAITPDGRRMVTGSDDNTVRVWDLSSAPPAATVLEGHSGAIWSVAITPDGRHVVTGSDDHTARVWDLSRGIPVATPLEGHRGQVLSVAITPDGQWVVTGSSDNTAGVWDLSGVTPVLTVLRTDRAPVESVAITPDGRRVVTGLYDGTAQVWDLSGAAPAANLLEGHRGQILSVAISLDGRRVVTGSSDKTARLWDLSGTSPAATVLGDLSSMAIGVAVSPDGQRAIILSRNAVLVWPTPPIEELIPLARAALTRCLTIAQRDTLGLPVLPGASPDREHIDPPPCP
jgi:WD40 repeat protein